MKKINILDEKDIVFDSLWNNAKQSIWKLETLQDYADDHNELYDLFTKNKISELQEKYLEIIKDENPAILKKFIRVHLIQNPLSNYLLFEIEIYKLWQQKGASIFFANNEDFNLSYLETIDDLILFDDTDVIVNKYDKETKYIGSEHYSKQEDDIEIFINIRNQIQKKSVPMNKFIL